MSSCPSLQLMPPYGFTIGTSYLQPGTRGNMTRVATSQSVMSVPGKVTITLCLMSNMYKGPQSLLRVSVQYAQEKKTFCLYPAKSQGINKFRKINELLSLTTLFLPFFCQLTSYA